MTSISVSSELFIRDIYSLLVNQAYYCCGCWNSVGQIVNAIVLVGKLSGPLLAMCVLCVCVWYSMY